MNSTPLSKYQQLIAEKHISEDVRQLHVVQAFDSLYKSLMKGSTGFWIFKRKSTPKGIYIHGHVGRGKTFLMDLFVESIPSSWVMRKHFHDFMLWFHAQLRQIKNKEDPIKHVVKKLSQKIKILCLDEFLVLDITDAMILARMLEHFETQGISLVTTSNIQPQDLYYGGLQRKKFLPAIDWLKQNMHILHLDGDNDFRQFHSGKQDLWIHPINAGNEQLFEEIFNSRIKSEKLRLSPIEVNSRKIPVIKRTDHHIMFEFESLCMDARSANDYIYLAKNFETVFMVVTHKIATQDRNTARRFITMVDVFYDHKLPLHVLSVVDFPQMYDGEELRFEMQRTHSRLTEMQSF